MQLDFNYIDRTSPAASNDKKAVEWVIVDRIARGIISSFIEINICMQLVNLTSARDMWLHFHGLCQQTSHTHTFAIY